MIVTKREMAGLALMLVGIVIYGATGADEWSWPLNVLAWIPAFVPGGLLLIPGLEKRVNRRLGRPVQ